MTRGRQEGETGGALAAVSDLAKRFGERQAVDHIAIDQTQGSVQGFVGPNGAGKTTTLRMLAGLLPPDSAEGQVLGHRLTSEAGEIRAKVGYMPQRLALYGELSVYQNLRFRADVYGLPKPREAVDETLSAFALDPFRRAKAGSLSGGWARRLQFAATVIHGPKLLLLDEPTAGLDAIAKLEVWRHIGELAAAGAGVIVNTHDLLEAEQCDAVSLFATGRIVARGAPHDVTRALAVRVLVLEGPELRAAAAELATHDGALAIYPEGRRLRLVARPGEADELVGCAEGYGLAVAQVETRLEDMEFALAAPLGRAVAPADEAAP